jgi:hypothetical protein
MVGRSAAGACPLTDDSSFVCVRGCVRIHRSRVRSSGLGSGAASRSTSACPEVTHPAQRAAGRTFTCCALRPPIAGQVGDHDFAGAQEFIALFGGKARHHAGDLCVASVANPVRNRPAVPGQRHSDRPGIMARSARDQARAGQAIHQPHAAGMGQADDLAQYVNRIVRREVEQRNQRSRGTAVQLRGLHAGSAHSVGQSGGHRAKQVGKPGIPRLAHGSTVEVDPHPDM